MGAQGESGTEGRGDAGLRRAQGQGRRLRDMAELEEKVGAGGGAGHPEQRRKGRGGADGEVLAGRAKPAWGGARCGAPSRSHGPRAAQEEAGSVRGLPGRWGLAMQLAARGEGASRRRDGGVRGGRSGYWPRLPRGPRPPRPPSSPGTHCGGALGAAGRRVRTWPQAARATDGWGVRVCP